MGKIITPAKRGMTAVVSLNGIELGAQKTAQLMQTMSVMCSGMSGQCNSDHGW